MNPPATTQQIGPEAAPPAPRPHLEDPSDTPLTGEDLIGDLDPGWLDWRDEQAGR